MECYSCTTENIIVDESWCSDKDQLNAHAPGSKMTCPGIMNRCAYYVASKFSNITVIAFCNYSFTSMLLIIWPREINLGTQTNAQTSYISEIDENEIITRSCGPLPDAKTKCDTIKANGDKATICYCDTDLCNSAGNLGLSLAFLSIFVIIGGSIF